MTPKTYAGPVRALMQAIKEGADHTTVLERASMLPLAPDLPRATVEGAILTGYQGDLNALRQLARDLVPHQAIQITERQEGVYDTTSWAVAFDWPFSGRASQAVASTLHVAWLLAMLEGYLKRLEGVSP